ncbi:MAG: chitobiase/beta-hexosaminidase C-terminal domain-containing protein [Patescibacteria group bacterium]|nr:chitobiase/beta-hexosaminidase C-terminal domain-containing protein [Patescibacteria group bacterium]
MTKKRFLVVFLLFASAFIFYPNFSKAANWTIQDSNNDGIIYSIDFKTKQIGSFGGQTSTYRPASGYSTSGGSIWNTIDTSILGVDQILGLSMDDFNNIFAVSAMGNIIKSVDGNPYTIQSTIDFSYKVGPIKAINAETLYLPVSNGATGNLHILKSIDGGLNFTTEYTGSDHISYEGTSLDCYNSDYCVVTGSSGSGTTVAYLDGSGVWTSSSGLANVDIIFGISMVDETTVYAVGQDPYNSNPIIYKSTNGGKDWTAKNSHGLTGIAFRGVDFVDNNTGWVVGDNTGGQGVILYTTDGGDTWTQQDSNVDKDLYSISAHSLWRAWAAGESGTILSYDVDNVAPATVASPSTGEYNSSQNITLSASDSVSGVAATYYTTDGTDPTTSSTQYSSPITISETTTLKFFSVDNAENSEAVKTEIYTISTTPPPTPFDYKIKLKNALTDTTYHSAITNTDLVFYRLPKRGAITDLYVKLTRNKKGYNSNFIKKLSYPGHVTLTSNIGLVDKDYYKNVDKHIKFKVAIRYSQNKINKLNLKEGKLRLYYKTENGIWKGPFTVYQNKDKNVIKFKIRNYLLKDNTADIASTNRTYSPTFYFKDLTKIKFIIAEKGALGLQLEMRKLL